MTSSQAEEAEEFQYELAGTQEKDDAGEPVPGSGRKIRLKKPTEAQVAVMIRLQSMLEDSPLAGVELYMDTLGSLMRDDDEQWCLRALLRGRLEIEAFTETGQQTLLHFFPELKAAQEKAEKTSRTHGPQATRRPRRS